MNKEKENKWKNTDIVLTTLTVSLSARDLIEVTKDLYSFNDVKGICKLYNQYRKRLTDKHSDKIKLNCNPLTFRADYKQPPPNLKHTKMAE